MVPQAGFGEGADAFACSWENRLRSVVIAAAVTPMMMNVPGNSEGPLEKSKAARMSAQLTADQDAFFDQFTREFFSANGEGVVLVTEEQLR